VETKIPPPAWKTVLAFATIYLVWGSTFLAIRVGVREVPPFLFAAMRFSIAGLALFGWTMVRGEGWPSRQQWMIALLPSLLIFVFDYGLLFWAEQRVPSGIAAVIMGTIPVFMALSEIFLLKTQKATIRLSLALLIGCTGVAVLVSQSLNLGGAAIDRRGAAALAIAALSWSAGSVLMRKSPLSTSKIMASGMQMLVGGILLSLAAAVLGEFNGFHPRAISPGTWFSLLYLIIAGSVVAFTTYVWLIHHESPTKVGTYAYVNPVVAVMVGHFLGGESLDLRTILGSLFVLTSVLLITTTQVEKAKAKRARVAN